MPIKNLVLERAQEAVRRVEDALREGYTPGRGFGSGRPALPVAAERAVKDGFATSAGNFRDAFNGAREIHGLEPDWSLYRPARYQQPQPKALVNAAPPPPPDAFQMEKGQRILVWPDSHQDPRHPHRLDTCTWIGRMCEERRPERVIQLGDFGSFDSVSRHDRNDTQKGRLKPSINDDLENLFEGLARFNKAKGGFKPKLHCTLGNHEDRIRQFENNNPELGTVNSTRLLEAFSQFGWRTTAYLEMMQVEDVWFTHHPTNGMGRAFGGETGPQRAANKSTCSIVSGHTHRRSFFQSAKIGPQGGVDMVECGCSLPWGEYEHYTATTPSDWWWGVVEMTVRNGRIGDLEFISMDTIRDRYSDDGADVRAA